MDKQEFLNELLRDYYMANRSIVTLESFCRALLFLCYQKKKWVWYKDDLIVELYKLFRRLDHNYTPITIQTIIKKLYQLRNKKLVVFQKAWLYYNPFFPDSNRWIVNVLKSEIERFLGI